MNANDGSCSNAESSNEGKKDKGESVDNKTENAEAEVVTNTADVTSRDAKLPEGRKHNQLCANKSKMIIIFFLPFFFLKRRQTRKIKPNHPKNCHRLFTSDFRVSSKS